MTYTVEQIRAAVEGLLDEDGEASGDLVNRPYPESHPYASFGSRQYQTVGWDEVYGQGFFVIDGENVDYEVVATTGGMDEGSNLSVTFKVGEQYFRKSGYYASHYGSDWDGELTEVHPVQKVVTVFE